MERTIDRRNGTPVPPVVLERVRALLGRLGERGTLTRLSISRATLARVLAGLSVTAGTQAVLREKFDAIEAEERRRQDVEREGSR